MTEKLDLPAIGKLYGYTPPKPEPTKALNIDWSAAGLIKDKLEAFFLEALPELEVNSSVEVVHQSLPSAIGPLHFTVNFSKSGMARLGLIFDLTHPKEGYISRTLYNDLDTPVWANTHRLVEASYRRQGIQTRFYEFADVCAETRAFQFGEELQITAKPYQLDVLNGFLAAGFEPGNPEQLERIRRGEEKLRIHSMTDMGNPMGEERPWCISDENDGLICVPVVKTFK